MSEEQKMQQQSKRNVNVITTYNKIPYSVIADDLSKSKKSDYYEELEQIIDYYDAYEQGQEFLTEGSNADYVPSNVRFKKAASIINKEARFLFANPPTFNININDTSEEAKGQNTIMQEYLDTVIEKNGFNNELLKAAKDCFIGKRVALVLNFNEESGITITFLNAFEFIYEFSGNNKTLTKITTFYNMNDATSKNDQRWFKKTYSLENHIVYVEEKIYDGLGKELEVVIKKKKTRFTYIPAVVILNDGLTGEHKGKSEIGYLLGSEGVYSKLANADIDAERKGMNPVRYTIDASRGSTKDLSAAPGAYWDLQSDETKEGSQQATAGVLETSMGYYSALKTTLDRIENNMYDAVDVPNINSEKLQGVITSGKTLKALYWGLTVRCDEKMLAWGEALRLMATAIIDGGRLYPKCITNYTTESVLPDIKCKILVENNYPLPEDETEEKNMDLAEINTQTMSRKAYLKKWRKLSDEDADKELQQIKMEMDLFENSVMPPTEELLS